MTGFAEKFYRHLHRLGTLHESLACSSSAPADRLKISLQRLCMDLHEALQKSAPLKCMQGAQKAGSYSLYTEGVQALQRHPATTDAALLGEHQKYIHALLDDPRGFITTLKTEDPALSRFYMVAGDMLG